MTAARLGCPSDDDWCLDAMVPAWIGDQPMRWRVDAESGDSSESAAYGFIQRWAETNPSMHFIGISADHFAPDDEKLEWAGSLPNLIIGHTVSAWFSPEELESRFASAERYKRHGIHTIIWICTDRSWAGNEEVLRRALDIVPPTHIIEVPHSRAKAIRAHESPFLGVLACQNQRRDMLGRPVRVVQEGSKFRHEVLLSDGTTDVPYKSVHGRCWGCQVKCGETAVFGATSAVDGQSPFSPTISSASLQLLSAEGGR